MGAVCEKNKSQDGAVTQTNELNPFATGFTKKERVLLKETWSAIEDAKAIVGVVFLEVLEVEPEVKAVFGVQRVPRTQLLKTPRLGGHVARFTDHMDGVIHTLGFMDNPLGAWQSVRKVGRAHGSKQMVPALMEKKNFFHLVASHFLTRILPYMTGQVNAKGASGGEKKAVRFAPAYPPQQIETVWERFIAILVTEMTASFKTEHVRRTNQHTLAVIAPHQAAEEEMERKNRRKRQAAADAANGGRDHPSAISNTDEPTREELIPHMDIGDRMEDN